MRRIQKPLPKLPRKDRYIVRLALLFQVITTAFSVYYNDSYLPVLLAVVADMVIISAVMGFGLFLEWEAGRS